MLTKRFRFHDLQVSAVNLRRIRSSPSDILDRVDTDAIRKKADTHPKPHGFLASLQTGKLHNRLLGYAAL